MGATVDPTAVAQDSVQLFFAAFDEYVRAVRRARGARPEARPDALTLSQFALLEGLSGRPDARVHELASSAGVTAPTATRILDVLERRGIVHRTRASDDRRAVTVTLTEAGRKLLAEQVEWMRGRELAFYEAMPAQERELAPDLLLRLAALIDEIAAGPEA